MSLSAPSSSDDLDSVLLQVMSATGPEAKQRIEQLQQTHPQFASEITECWELHQGFLETTGHVPSSSTESSNVSPRLGSRIGARLGTYELLDELDRGGMGIVYRARHPLLDRTVALKVIRSGELADAVEVHRFQTEARAAARLSHPGIIAIYEVGQEGDLVYYTMPLVEGQTLSSFMNALRIEPRESARIVHQLALAMDHAHSRGVIHRDLKPSNVLLHADMHPVIIDFGLAKISQSAADVTGDGIVGTPAYIAPEQLRGGSPELPHACDVYALGGILYFLLSGRAPFVGPTTFDILLQVKDREPMAPSHWNRNVSSELNAICARAMEKNPRNRYPSAAALAEDLQRWMIGEPIAIPTHNLAVQLARWWRKAPSLFSHSLAIVSVMLIVSAAHAWDISSSDFLTQMGLLATWLVLCWPLQRWAASERNGWIGASLWALVDVTFTSCLIAKADAPRGLLLIAYPMMIAASALFYRTRMVIGMTILCVVGFSLLAWLTEDSSLDRIDFQAIFVTGLAVLGLTLSSMIGRVRNLFSMSRSVGKGQMRTPW